MENASKALIMAGGILIGILILTLAVYLFATFGTEASKVNDRIKEQQIEQFNSDFISYVDSDNITIYDVITVANRAKEFNGKNNFTALEDTNYYIKVSLNSTPTSYPNLEQEDEKEYQKLLEYDRGLIKINSTTNDIDYLPKYKCKAENVKYNDEGRIIAIAFEK